MVLVLLCNISQEVLKFVRIVIKLSATDVKMNRINVLNATQVNSYTKENVTILVLLLQTKNTNLVFERNALKTHVMLLKMAGIMAL